MKGLALSSLFLGCLSFVVLSEFPCGYWPSPRVSGGGQPRLHMKLTCLERPQLKNHELGRGLDIHNFATQNKVQRQVASAFPGRVDQNPKLHFKQSPHLNASQSSRSPALGITPYTETPVATGQIRALDLAQYLETDPVHVHTLWCDVYI